MTHELRFSATRRGRTTNVLAVAGEVDLAVTAALHNAADNALRGDGVRRLILDFAGVTFLDCAGISVLLSTNRTAQAAGINAVVVNCCPLVLRILELTGVASLLLG